MDNTGFYKKKKKEIIKFNSFNIWENKEYEEFKSKNKVTLIGKYNMVLEKKSYYFFDELEDVNKNKITLLTTEETRKDLKNGENYEMTGILKVFPDRYSVKLKLYTQMKLIKAKKIESAEEYPDFFSAIRLKESLLKIKAKENKKEIDIIYSKLEKKEKVRFLIITSLKGNNGTNDTDIMNDLYKNGNYKNEIQKFFGFTPVGDENIIRTSFNDYEFMKEYELVKEIEKKISEAQKQNISYDYLVFIKGGGSKMKLFDDIDFCNEIVKLNIPFITALGHSDDNFRLLCQLADIDCQTPSYLGQDLIKIINITKNKLENKNNKIINERMGEERQNKKVKGLEEKVRKLNLKFVISLFIIIFLLGYIVFSTFFMKQNIDTPTTLPKKISTKKLVYSEDEVFTVLLWKGYKGEKAIYAFQKDNKMQQTGKVNEALLKKLGIKIKYNE